MLNFKRIIKKNFKFILIILTILSILTGTITYNFLSSHSKSGNVKILKYNQVKPGEDKITGTDYVSFDAYILKDSAKYRGVQINTSSSAKLNIDLKVYGDVTLKDAVINFDNKNVSLSGSIVKSTAIPRNLDSSNYTSINLANVGNGLSTLIRLNINPKIIDESDLSNSNKVILTGTVVDNITGKEIAIKKEVKYDVDWYTKNLIMEIDSTSASFNRDNNTATYRFVTRTSGAPIKDVVLQGTVSSLFGNKPTNVKVYSSANREADYVYDPINQTFQIVIPSGKKAYDYIMSGKYYNSWTIVAEYSQDIDVTKLLDFNSESMRGNYVSVYLTSWAHGYNNTKIVQDELASNKVNNTLGVGLTNYYPRPTGQNYFKSALNINADFIKYSGVDKEYKLLSSLFTDLYKGIEVPEKITYTVGWSGKLEFRDGKKARMEIYENGDYFKTAKDTSSFVRYKKIKATTISSNSLTVYNGSNNQILCVLTKEKSSYEIPNNININNIYIKSNDITKLGDYDFGITIEKEIDTNKLRTTFTEEMFNSFETFTTNIRAQGVYDNVPIRSDKVLSAKVLHEKYYTDISLDKETEYQPESMADPSFNMNIRVSHKDYSDIAVNLWKDYKYLVVFPSNMVEVELNNEQLPEQVINYEKTKIEDNIIYKFSIKNTKENNILTNLPFKVTLNKKTLSGSERIYVYSSTNTDSYATPSLDVYDLNENGSNIDSVNLSSAYMKISIPNEVITGAIISNYDESGNNTMSPLTADIEILDGKQEADMDIFVINNGLYPIKDIVILGKTGYVDNTYVLGSGKLGSEFDAPMVSKINIPDELNGKAKVYYSVLENPTKDIEDVTNQWQEEPDNLSLVKSYMIVVDNSYKLNCTKELSFTYKTAIPNNYDNLYKKSYFNHGVFFNYVTSDGDAESNAGSGRLGIQIANIYDLEITNQKAYSDLKLRGSAYKLEDEEGNQYTAVTDLNGKVIFKNLYSNKTYSLVQEKINKKYVLDKTKRTFSVNLQDDLSISLEKTGTYKSFNFDHKKLSMTLENEMYYDLDIKVLDVDNNTPVMGYEFEVTGKNLSNEMSYFTTSDGLIHLYGLEINNEYLVTPKTGNYIATKPFKIMVIRDSSTHEVNIGIADLPELKIPTSTQQNGYSLRKNDDGSYNITNDYSGTHNGSVEIDLSKFKNDYVLNGSITFYGANVKGSDIARVYLNTTNNATNAIFNHVSPGTFNYDIDNQLTKGSKNYLYMSYKKVASATNFKIENLKVIPVNGKREIFSTDTNTGYVNKDNSNAVETLTRNEASSVEKPLLSIDFKAKKAMKYNLNIKKVDGITNTKLAGAIFNIVGPGLPTEGKFIETDENGAASIELYGYIDNGLSNIPGFEGLNNYPISGEYTLTEVLAPIGYVTDSKPIKFKYSLNSWLDNSVLNLSYGLEYLETDKEFDTYSANNDNLNVTIKNYPNFQIVKKDEKTGEVLPNTYFAIYKVENYGEIDEMLLPATDSNGKLVGEKIKIDNKYYNVLLTNENGRITANLSDGVYLLYEVQASDEKYDIEDQKIYFTIGKAIEPKHKGIDKLTIENAFNSSSNNTRSEYLFTKDGGKILIDYSLKGNEEEGYEYMYKSFNKKEDGTYELVEDGPFYQSAFKIVKYDKDGNIEWSNKLPQSIQIIDNVNKAVGTNYIDSGVNLVEVSDGYILKTYYDGYIKLDSKGNILYDSINRNNPRISVSGENSKNAVNYPLGVYGVNSLLWDEKLVELSNGHIMMFVHNRDYDIETKDGRLFSYEDNSNNDLDYIKQAAFVEYDKDGYIVEVYPFGEKLKTSVEKYFADNDVNYKLQTFNDVQSTQLFKLPNDELLLFIVGRDYYNTPLLIKVNNKFNITNITTPSVNGIDINYLSNLDLNVYDDGSISYLLKGYTEELKSIKDINNFDKTDWKFSSNYANLTSKNLFEYTFGDPYYGISYKGGYENGIYAVKLDSDLNINNVVQLTTTQGHITKPNKEMQSWNRIYMGEPGINYDAKGLAHKFLRDGSVIATFSKNSSHLGSNVSLQNGNSFYLANGELYKTPGYNKENELYTLIYKVNPDSSIEWAKSIDSSNETLIVNSGIDSSTYNTTKLEMDKSEKTFMISAASNVDIYNLPSVRKIHKLMTFTITDEVKPGVVAGHVIEVLNKIKNFNINVTTNSGGNIIVKKGSNIVYEGPGKSEIEKVEYDQNSIYDIIVKPDDNYSVTKVTVNGEQMGYTVKNDGSLLLDKIPNVKETKNIDIEFTENLSNVIVHHYKKGTTERISSDELLTGSVGTDYVTESINSDIYGLAKDSNGEYIIPSNYKGKYTTSPITVIYYYEPRMVNLKINYYEEGTDNKLADTTNKEYLFGSKYKTEPKIIQGYKLSSVLGLEQGELNSSEEEVIYFYNTSSTPNKSVITTIYYDDTNDKEIGRKIDEINIGDKYTTIEMENIPSNYKLDYIDGEPSGIANNPKITVTYHYKHIPDSPKTGDNIIYYVIIGIISVITLIISTKYIIKRRAN